MVRQCSANGLRKCIQSIESMSNGRSWDSVNCRPRGSPFQMPTRLADGLGPGSDLRREPSALIANHFSGIPTTRPSDRKQLRCIFSGWQCGRVCCSIVLSNDRSHGLERRRKLTDSPISEAGDRMQGNVPGKAAQVRQLISPIVPSFVFSSVFDDILGLQEGQQGKCQDGENQKSFVSMFRRFART